MRRTLLERLISVADSLDKMGLRKQASVIDQAIQVSAAKYNGYSNYDTYHAALLINNEYSLYQQLRQLVTNKTPEKEIATALQKMFKGYVRSLKEKPKIDLDEVDWANIAQDEIKSHDIDEQNN